MYTKFASVFLYLTLLSALSGCSIDINYSDEAMIRHFKKNEQLFNELATSALQADKLKFFSSCNSLSCYGNRKTETYRAYLEGGGRVETGFDDMSEAVNSLDLVSLRVERRGYERVYMERLKKREIRRFDPDSNHAVKGYLYSTEPTDPRRLEDNLKGSLRYNDDIRFRHIDGPWYLYISINVS